MPLVLVAVFGTDPPWKLDAKHVAEIEEAAGSRFEVYQAASREDVQSRLGEAEVMYGFRLSAADIPEAVNLKWVQGTSAGVEGALYPELVASDIILTSAAGIHAVQISEQAVGMMISLTRKFPSFMRNQIKKQWKYEHDDAGDLGELYGNTLGIIGLGHIGEALAERAKAFGMKVLGVKTSTLGYEGAADEVLGADGMMRVMRESDFVVAILPHTKATRGMISAEHIDAMKPTAYFLNFGRGKTVDEPALVKALEEGRIAGAGLDVFAEEPLPKRSALWKMDNVIITPHVAGITTRYWQRATALFVENLRRYMAGSELLNVVDKEIGY